MRSKDDDSRRWFDAKLAKGARARILSVALALLTLSALGQVSSAVGGQERRAPLGNQPVYGGAKSGSGSELGSSHGPGSVLVDPGEDYRIGAGDVIEVEVQDAPELSRAVRVTTGGTFLMPYVGRITAVQKTPEELSASIADKLRGRYLKDPKVTVLVKEYNSCSFFIQGAVRSPGVYQMEGHPSLLKLITLAGLAENHGSTAFILRPAKQSAEKNGVASSEKVDAPANNGAGPLAAGSGAEGLTQESHEYELLKVNINGLLKGHFEQNAVMSPGDIINIPTTDVFFVAGEVIAPGTFQLKEGTTLRQAISMAQGTTFKAATSRGLIFREDPATGKRQEVKVDLGAVMSGKKEDVALFANDIVIVPNSLFKSVGKVLLTGLGTSAAMRVPYY